MRRLVRLICAAFGIAASINAGAARAEQPDGDLGLRGELTAEFSGEAGSEPTGVGNPSEPEVRPAKNALPARLAGSDADRNLVLRTSLDELGMRARIGQMNGQVRQWARRGTRPRQPADQRCDNAYLFGAICPARGAGAALALPHATPRPCSPTSTKSRAMSPRAPAPCCFSTEFDGAPQAIDVPENITRSSCLRSGTKRLAVFCGRIGSPIASSTLTTQSAASPGGRPNRRLISTRGKGTGRAGLTRPSPERPPAAAGRGRAPPRGRSAQRPQPRPRRGPRSARSRRGAAPRP